LLNVILMSQAGFMIPLFVMDQLSLDLPVSNIRLPTGSCTDRKTN